MATTRTLEEKVMKPPPLIRGAEMLDMNRRQITRPVKAKA